MCLTCLGVFVWECPPWALSLVPPWQRKPTPADRDAVKGMTTTGEALLATAMWINRTAAPNRAPRNRQGPDQLQALWVVLLPPLPRAVGRH